MNLLTELQQVVQADLGAVHQCLERQLTSPIHLIEAIGQRILSYRGKRLRPLLLLLTAKSCHHQHENRITLAAVLELIHAATLLHDDVVDGSELRRSQPTANAVHGNSASVLVGDFLYSRSFQLMASLNETEVMRLLSNTTNKIAEGEVLQLMHLKQFSLSEADYFKTIECKTAELFAAAAELGCLLSPHAAKFREIFREIGLRLGIAFQLIDDALDYEGDSDILGKNIGDDFSEGKLTFPVIYTQKVATASDCERLQHAFLHPEEANFEAIKTMLVENGALIETRQRAAEEIARVRDLLSKIQDEVSIDYLMKFSEFVVSRDH